MEPLLTGLREQLQGGWDILSDRRHYLIPESLEDYRSLGLFPDLKIGGADVFASSEAREALIRCARRIREVIGSHLFSLHTISTAIMKEVAVEFTAGTPRPLLTVLQAIEESILATNRPREWIRAISGIMFENLDEVRHGAWRLVRFTRQLVDEISQRDSSDPSWQNEIRDLLRSSFEDRICIIVKTAGDQIQSRRAAARIARFVVDSFRYLASIYYGPAGHAHDVGIQLGISGRKGGLSEFEQTLDSYASTVYWGDERLRQPYILTQSNLDRFREDWGVEDLWSLAVEDRRTDLDEGILTALSWFGDAQSDDDANVSYVKYWTGLEALVTAHSRRTVSSRLATAIPIMLEAQGDTVSYNEVRSAYDLRSRIVHGGGQANARREDLDLVNAWMVQCLSLCVRLRSLGYRTRSVVEAQSRQHARPRTGRE